VRGGRQGLESAARGERMGLTTNVCSKIFALDNGVTLCAFYQDGEAIQEEWGW
jgi:hypothetical protein